MMTDAFDRTEDDCEAIFDDAGPPEAWPDWTDAVRVSAATQADDLPPGDPELDRLARRFADVDAAFWALNFAEPYPPQSAFDAMGHDHSDALLDLIEAMDARCLAWCRGGDFLIVMHPESLLPLLCVPIAPGRSPAPRMEFNPNRPRRGTLPGA